MTKGIVRVARQWRSVRGETEIASAISGSRKYKFSFLTLSVINVLHSKQFMSSTDMDKKIELKIGLAGSRIVAGLVRADFSNPINTDCFS